ncbi:hypothetical protein RCCS2_14794 [Roseobacter sp. CCS2]|nr:hypothetical protein RCCS2_14794 [Roseobacter sp. CCS2]
MDEGRSRKLCAAFERLLEGFLPGDDVRYGLVIQRTVCRGCVATARKRDVGIGWKGVCVLRA